MAFSLTEKLAVAGAFLALVALAVGTENDPGVVVTGKDKVATLRPSSPSARPDKLVESTPGESRSKLEPEPASSPLPAAPAPASGPPITREYSPELGRVPIDLSKGPPGT